MLRSLAVLVLLLSLATATPVVCLCMPTDHGYRLMLPEHLAPAAADAPRDERLMDGLGTAAQASAPTVQTSALAERPPAQQPVGAAIAALALIATAVAPAAADALSPSMPAPRRLLAPTFSAPPAVAAAPPAPPPRDQG